MGFKRMALYAGIGGLLYAHRKHGGEWTVESFKQSWNDLIDGFKARAKDLRSQAESKLHEAATKVSDATDSVESFTTAKDVTGYGSSNYGYGGGSKAR